MFSNGHQRSKVGSQWDENTYQGPQVSKVQYERILELIESGKKQGSTLAAGRTPHKIDDISKYFYITPTVFTETSTTSRIQREETFGPVVVIASFKTEVDAVSLADDTLYGLGAAVFTTNLERGHRVAANIEAGLVWVNSSQDCDRRVSFGGRYPQRNR